MSNNSGPKCRESRITSFCETVSSSKSSCRNSASSLLEDDGSSSDAGASSNDYDYDRLSNNDIHAEDDLECKIKWFFQRIEQE
jgi:hypothetical protein